MRTIIFLICVIFMCIVCAIVIAMIPSIVYPDDVINVKLLTDSTYSFELRCDLEKTQMLFVACNATTYVATPVCTGRNYITQVYAFGIIECPTRYLRNEFHVHRTKSWNVIAFVFSVMMILSIVFAIIIVILLWRRCRKDINTYEKMDVEVNLV